MITQVAVFAVLCKSRSMVGIYRSNAQQGQSIHFHNQKNSLSFYSKMDGEEEKLSVRGKE